MAKAKEAEVEEAPELVEEITVLLTRAAPSELSGSDLEEEIAGDSDELRAALKWMADNGKIDTEAPQFRLAGSAAPSEQPVPGEPEDDSGGNDEDPYASPDAPADGEAAAISTPSTGLPVTATMTLKVNFNRGPNDDDDAVANRVRAIWQAIGHAIQADSPKLDVLLDVEKIETFDSPRVIFRAGSDGNPE